MTTAFSRWQRACRAGRGAAVAASLGLAQAQAAGIVATVTDEPGKPLAEAVVMIMPDDGTPMPAAPARTLMTANIDQRDETFVPEVVVIHVGGAVTFRNSDPTRHHVYSFSPIKQFEFVQNPHAISAPVRFDVPGSAAIGCNIHDNMIAYVFVTTAPWAAVTDENGRAVIGDLPAGHFVATVWHPRLRPSSKPPATSIVLASQDTTLAVTIPVRPPRRPRTHDSLY
jgi:plastocyanin